MKRILAILLCVLSVFSILPTIAFADETEIKNGDLVVFGSYPQSRVTDNALVDKLNAYISNYAFHQKWESFGFYSGNQAYGSMKPSDYMKYMDVKLDGAYYRAVTFSSFRASGTPYWQNEETSYQDNNGYYTDEIYWFNYEPIVWQVLDKEEGLLMSKALLDTQAHSNTIYNKDDFTIDEKGKYQVCNYEKSTIREWLNKDFVNTAFDVLQKLQLISKYLDNTPLEPYYWMEWGGNTNDKVFLLSHEDVMNEKYSFEGENIIDKNRAAYGTDYAKCLGLPVDTKEDSSKWFLRTAGSGSIYINAVNPLGIMEYHLENSYECLGIRPVIKVSKLHTLELYEPSQDMPDSGDNVISDDNLQEDEVYPPEEDENIGDDLLYPEGSWIEFAADRFSAGKGTKKDPYIITSAEELALMSKLVNAGIRKYQKAYYLLGNDIDLSAHEWFPIGNGELEEAAFLQRVQFENSFLGVFDGGGHTISGMHIDNAYDKKYAHGLFGVSFGYISNIVLKEPVIKINRPDLFPTSIVNMGLSEGMCVGAIAGDISGIENSYHNVYCPMSIIRNCIVIDADIDVLSSTDVTVGCLAGSTDRSVISDCIVTGSIDAYSKGCHISVGGIIGDLEYFSNISRCSFNGDIKSGNDPVQDNSGYYFPNFTGGAFGNFGAFLNFSDCSAVSTIDYTQRIESKVGSLVGSAEHCDSSYIKNACSTAQLTMNNEKIEHCESLGSFPNAPLFCNEVNIKNIVGVADGVYPGIDDKYVGKYVAHSLRGRLTKEEIPEEYEIFTPNHQKQINGDEAFYFDESFSFEDVFKNTLGFDENVWIFYEDKFPTLKSDCRKDCVHDYIESDMVINPACNSFGVVEYKCTICSFAKKELTDKAPGQHINTKTVAAVLPTEDSVGYTEGVYCRDCKKYISGHDEISKIDIGFVDNDDAIMYKSFIFTHNNITVQDILDCANEGAVIYDTSENAAAPDMPPVTGMTIKLSEYITAIIVVIGDVDSDGGVTASDARLALRASVGLERVYEYNAVFFACDADRDDRITASDARLILRASVGLEDSKEWLR